MNIEETQSTNWRRCQVIMHFGKRTPGRRLASLSSSNYHNFMTIGPFSSDLVRAFRPRIEYLEMAGNKGTGGARSLALTVLRLSSQLTGKNTGDFRHFALGNAGRSL